MGYIEADSASELCFSGRRGRAVGENMNDDTNRPATLADLSALEERLNGRLDRRIEATEIRFTEQLEATENRLIEKMRDMQSELLRGFRVFSDS